MQHRAFLAAIFLALLVAAPVCAQKATPTGTLSGVVKKADGTPQAGARVYLQPSDGHPAHTMKTDASGHFKFENIRVGLYDVRAQASGLWSNLHRNVNVRASDELTIDLQLKPADPQKPKNR
jgi:uncharacterized protein YfaS (alpha-2-macroglobulin family)